MFIRRRKNKSGTTSVVVVDKNNGKFRELKTIGVAADEAEIEMLERKAKLWIEQYSGRSSPDFNDVGKARSECKSMLSNVDRGLLDMPQAIPNTIYGRIGFNAIDDGILRHLVVARVCQPMSKAATVDCLKSHFDEDVRPHNIYGYMDRLYDTQRKKVQQISVERTMKAFGDRIGLVSYDVTTLCFESMPQPDDELRQAGFSKDGKTAESQIVLGLLVRGDGCPLSCSVFKGIEAHICICFLAYKVYKELERIIRTIGLGISVDKVLRIAKTITTIRLRLPNGETYSQTLFTKPQQESIKPLLDTLKIGGGE